MSKLILILVFTGFTSNAMALTAAQVDAKFSEMADQIEPYLVQPGKHNVFYGKVTKWKNNGYYQCIAIAFLNVDRSSKKIDYVFKMWPAVNSDLVAGPRGSCEYGNLDRIHYRDSSSGPLIPWAPGKPICFAENTKAHGIQTRSLDPATMADVFQQHSSSVSTSKAGTVPATHGRVLDFSQSSSRQYGRAGLMKPCQNPAVHAAVTKKSGSDMYWYGDGQTGIIDVSIENGVFSLKATNGNDYRVNFNDPRDLANGEVPPSTQFHVN